MAELKLARLPDRTPVKISFLATPDLHQMLADYAALYRATYQAGADIADLVPAMLETFLAGDKAFAKARRTASPAMQKDHHAARAQPGARSDGAFRAS